MLGRPLRREAALSSATYVKDKWALLKQHGLTCYAISNHLVGQAVCDLIDERHKAILRAEIWGDGDPEGVRKRAAREMAGHRPRGGGLWREDGCRLHRLIRLALDLRLPADGPDVSGTRASPTLPTAGSRSSMSSRRST